MTYHLASTRSATSQHLRSKLDLASRLVRQLASNKVVHCELDGLFRRYTDKLGKHTGIQTLEPLILDDLLGAVERVLVEHMPNARAPLVLHPRLDKIDGVNHKGTKGTSQGSESKVVDRLEYVVPYRFCARKDLLACFRYAASCQRSYPVPGRVENAGKVSQAESPRSFVQTGKVEENVGLHGCVEIEATYPCGLVEKVGASNLAVVTLLCCIADYQLNHVHLLDDILEGADIGVGDLAPNRDVAERGQVLEEVVGELVARSLAYYALEMLGLDEAVLVLVKVGEALTHTLSL